MYTKQVDLHEKFCLACIPQSIFMRAGTPDISIKFIPRIPATKRVIQYQTSISKCVFLRSGCVEFING